MIIIGINIFYSDSKILIGILKKKKKTLRAVSFQICDIPKMLYILHLKRQIYYQFIKLFGL